MSNLKQRANRNGFTLVEMTVSIVLLSIVFAATLNLFNHVVKFYKRSYVRSELFHHATVAMDFFELQLRCAEKVELLETNKSGTLEKMRVHYARGSTESSIFIFDAEEPITDKQYHKLNFGGSANELAAYIKDIKIKMDIEKNIVSIEITTDKKLARYVGDGTKFRDVSLAEPVVLKREIYLRYTELEQVLKEDWVDNDLY